MSYPQLKDWIWLLTIIFAHKLLTVLLVSLLLFTAPFVLIFRAGLRFYEICISEMLTWLTKLSLMSVQLHARIVLSTSSPTKDPF